MVCVAESDVLPAGAFADGCRLRSPSDCKMAFSDVKLLVKSFKATRCRIVDHPSNEQRQRAAEALEAAGVHALDALDSFTNAVRLASSTPKWSVVRGLCILEMSGGNGAHVALRHWWSADGEGKWLDLTALDGFGGASTQRLLVETPLGEKDLEAAGAHSASFERHLRRALGLEPSPIEAASTAPEPAPALTAPATGELDLRALLADSNLAKVCSSLAHMPDDALRGALASGALPQELKAMRLHVPGKSLREVRTSLRTVETHVRNEDAFAGVNAERASGHVRAGPKIAPPATRSSDEKTAVEAFKWCAAKVQL